jgi:hypothetical protein
MPRYYFDVKNGTRLPDPAGLDCRDDADAEAKAKVIAQELSRDAPRAHVPRRILVLNDEGDEVSIIPVRKNHGGR